MLLYYILTHNKDVALKGFLRECRPSRLNHVTLVFTVFLFYASPFRIHSSIHNIVYHIALLIFNTCDRLTYSFHNYLHMLHSLNYLHIRKVFFSLIYYFYRSLYYFFPIRKYNGGGQGPTHWREYQTWPIQIQPRFNYYFIETKCISWSQKHSNKYQR